MMVKMGNDPLISVIVLNYNGKDMTAKFLESLKSTKFSDYETILVDNGSTDGTAEYVAENFPYVKIVKNKENLGVPGGMNAGIRISRGKYVCLMNNDMKVYPDWLGELLKAAESDEKIGIVVPMLMNDEKNIQTIGYVENGSLLLRFKRLGVGEVDNGQLPDIIELSHGNGLVKKEVLENAGFLDEKFFGYWDELDFCYRARRFGYKTVAATKSKVWNKGGGTFKKNSYIVIFHKHKNRIMFIVKNMGLFRKLLNLSFTLIYYLWEIVPAIYKKDFVTINAIRDGLAWNIKYYKDYF